jgi:hypothetical protein
MNETVTYESSSSRFPKFKKEIKYKVNRAIFERDAALLAEVFGDDIQIH